MGVNRGGGFLLLTLLEPSETHPAHMTRATSTTTRGVAENLQISCSEVRGYAVSIKQSQKGPHPEQNLGPGRKRSSERKAGVAQARGFSLKRTPPLCYNLS